MGKNKRGIKFLRFVSITLQMLIPIVIVLTTFHVLLYNSSFYRNEFEINWNYLIFTPSPTSMDIDSVSVFNSFP
jgi:hypothetical protein